MVFNTIMETDTIKGFLLITVITAAVVSFSYRIGCRDGRIEATRGDVERVDTMYIFDTITQYRPIVEERIKLQEVPVPVTDTLWLRDTLFVILEKEQVIWEDSLSKIYASGIQPQIDSVHHYITERIVTIELTKVVKKPCRWGIGINAGYGIQFGQEIKASPYIGVGVNYNILSW